MLEYKDRELFTTLEQLAYYMNTHQLFEELSKPSSVLCEEYDSSEYTWNVEETLEEQLYNVTLEEAIRDYQPGEIIMAKQYKTESGKLLTGAHMIFIVSASSKNTDGSIDYSGYLLSSQIHKANINSRYVNTIYFDNFNSILDGNVINTRNSQTKNTPGIVKVDEIVSCNSNTDLDVSGVLKGIASRDFVNFILQCKRNYETNQQKNKTMMWVNK